MYSNADSDVADRLSYRMLEIIRITQLIFKNGDSHASLLQPRTTPGVLGA